MTMRRSARRFSARIGAVAIAGTVVALSALVPVAAAGQSAFIDGGAPWTASGREALASDLRAAGQLEPLRSAHEGLIVIDARDGAPVYERNADAPITPASTLKLVVGLAALDRLGPDFTFVTSLETGAAPDATGTLDGDVRLRGGGDPVLRAADLSQAAKALANAGTRHIAGCVAIDASHFDRHWYGEGWMLEDLGSPFSAPISGLDLDENAVVLAVSPGPTVGAAASVEPTADVAIVKRGIVTGPPGSENTADVVPRDDRQGADLGGSVPIGRTSTVQLAIDDPEVRARRIFSDALRRNGLDFDETASCIGGPLAVRAWTHRSAPLGTILAPFWIRSDNLIAETLLKELGSRDGHGSWPAGLRAEASFLRRSGIAAGGYTIVDGSGLSRYDIVPPRMLARLLARAWSGPQRGVVLGALPTAGVRGSLPAPIAADTKLSGRLAAKTGSMTHVRGLAGYLATRRHGVVSFAWLVDDLAGDPAALARLQARSLDRIIDAP